MKNIGLITILLYAVTIISCKQESIDITETPNGVVEIKSGKTYQYNLATGELLNTRPEQVSYAEVQNNKLIQLIRRDTAIGFITSNFNGGRNEFFEVPEDNRRYGIDKLKIAINDARIFYELKRIRNSPFSISFDWVCLNTDDNSSWNLIGMNNKELKNSAISDDILFLHLVDRSSGASVQRIERRNLSTGNLIQDANIELGRYDLLKVFNDKVFNIGWNKILAHNTANLASAWSLDIDDFPQVVHDENTLYVSDRSSHLFAINTNTGAKIWEQDFDSGLEGFDRDALAIAIKDEKIVLATKKERNAVAITFYDKTDGQITKSIDLSINENFINQGDLIVFDRHLLLFAGPGIDEDAYMLLLNLEDSSVVWEKSVVGYGVSHVELPNKYIR